MRTVVFFIIVFTIPVLAFTKTIYIPQDYPSIQQGIDAASNGDMVSVAPGTYVENIDFLGKAITVQSEQGPDVTVIDGGNPVNPDIGSVVYFHSGEGLDSILDGFTLTHGSGTNLGSIVCGGGICCWPNSSPTIENNVIYGNSVSQSGGGIACYGHSCPTIANNVIFENEAIHAGGIMCNASSPTIMNNTIYGNNATKGGGIYWTSTCSPNITNKILWANHASLGPAIYAPSGGPPVTYCDIENGAGQPWFGNGCVDSDPLFFDPTNNDFHLQQDPCQPGIVNPCVDSGDPLSSMISGSTRTDRVQDIGVVDMGYHYTPGILMVPGNFATIQEAIDMAISGNTILVAPGTYVVV